jgi:hypothetical protein
MSPYGHQTGGKVLLTQLIDNDLKIFDKEKFGNLLQQFASFLQILSIVIFSRLFSKLYGSNS